MGLAFEQKATTTVANSRRDMIERVIRENSSWFSTVLRVFGSDALFTASFASVPFLPRKEIPFSPNVEYYSNGNEHIFMIGKRTIRIVTEERPTVYEYDEEADRDGLLADFIVKLASDPEVLKRILRNYYNIARAALILGDRYGYLTRYYPGHVVDDAAKAIEAIEELYLDLFGEMIEHDERVVKGLVDLFITVSKYNDYIEGRPEWLDMYDKQKPNIYWLARYTDTFTVDDATIVFDINTDKSVLYYKPTLHLNIYLLYKGDHLASFYLTSKRREIDPLIHLRCFECLDVVEKYMPYLDVLLYSLGKIYVDAARTLNTFLTVESGAAENYRPLTVKEMGELARDAEFAAKLATKELGVPDPNRGRSPLDMLADVHSMFPWFIDRLKIAGLSYSMYNYKTMAALSFDLTFNARDAKISVNARQPDREMLFSDVLKFAIEIEDIRGKRDIKHSTSYDPNHVLTDGDATNFRKMFMTAAKIKDIIDVYNLIRESTKNTLLTNMNRLLKTAQTGN